MGRCTRPGECLVGGKHQRDRAERRDKRPIHSDRHGSYRSLVAGQQTNAR
jgi:hypothetical protein